MEDQGGRYDGVGASGSGRETNKLTEDDHDGSSNGWDEAVLVNEVNEVDFKIARNVEADEPISTSEQPAARVIEDKDYSSFTSREKKSIVLTATIGAFFSPFTAQIYFPALNTIAKELHVSSSKINLTMTTYMVNPSSHSDSPSSMNKHLLV